MNPPSSLSDKPIPESYQRAFPEFSTLPLTPELDYFLFKAGLDTFPFTMADAYSFLQTNRLYNLEIIGDIVINKEIPTYKPVFTNEQTARYLKFVIIEAGLNGLF